MLKLKFDANQAYQQEAISSIVDIFEGQRSVQSRFTALESDRGLVGKITELGYANKLDLIDEDLIKINLYSDKFTYEIKNNVNNVTTKKKYINFYDTDLFESTIYQYVDTTNSNSNSYISGTYNTSISGNLDYIPQTLEAEIYFPKKEDISNNTFFCLL